MKKFKVTNALSALVLTFSLLTSFNAISSEKEMKMEKHSKKMDMDHMHMMMKDCMAKQADDKKCHQEILDKCEQSKSMKNCSEVMNKMKDSGMKHGEMNHGEMKK